MAQLAYMSSYFEVLEDRVDQLDNMDEAEELIRGSENSKSQNRD